MLIKLQKIHWTTKNIKQKDLKMKLVRDTIEHSYPERAFRSSIFGINCFPNSAFKKHVSTIVHLRNYHLASVLHLNVDFKKI